jgi:hypothetical protein
MPKRKKSYLIASITKSSTTMKKYLRPALYVLLGGLVLIQFFQIDKSNPPADPALDYLAMASPPAEVATLIRQACYDCHAHNTTYPWYAWVQPAGWWLRNHVEEGREHLNFAVWGTYPAGKAAHKLEECYEVIESSEMPMKSYTWMHAEARLSDAQRAQLVGWFRSEYQKAESMEAPSQDTPAQNGEHQEHEEGGERH